MRLPAFGRHARDIFGTDEEAWLDNILSQRPLAGVVIRGTGGVRKLRVAVAGRGKRGSARVIYYYQEARRRVFLIYAYTKNRKDDLTESDRRRVRQLVSELEAEA